MSTQGISAKSPDSLIRWNPDTKPWRRARTQYNSVSQDRVLVNNLAPEIDFNLGLDTRSRTSKSQ